MNDSTLAVATVTYPLAEDEDRELAARIARGDDAALALIVERYQYRVAGLAARLLGGSDGAEDCMQEVFLSLWRTRQSYRGTASLWTYLATFTVNRCRSVQRRRWLETRVRRLLLTPADVPQAPASDHRTAQEESQAVVRRAVAALPTKYREAIVLRYLEEMTIDEMVEVTGVKRNALEARLSRARKLLEESLRELSGE